MRRRCQDAGMHLAGGTWGRASAAIGIALVVLLTVPSARALAAAPAPSCPTGAVPYRLPGAHLVPTVHTSLDPHPVRYVLWRGTVPSFDGLPLSVDVTVPCDPTADAGGALPTVAMAHGFTDDKTVWEETGKSDTIHSKDRPGSNDEWNNIWFASRGYAVLTYTARGWHDSCGPDQAKTSTDCSGHQSWIHLDDKRWEVRDLQWLVAGLVAGGVADPARLAATGGSYGGAPALSAALLDGNVMCGGAPEPPALGKDSCAGRPNGALAPWTTPDGATRLHWAAALPLYTFTDLLGVLAPNGHTSDGWSLAPHDGSPADPIGVPLDSTIKGLLLAARVYGSLAPSGSDPDSDLTASTDRLLAGAPYDPQDPATAHDLEVAERFRSPITTAPHGRVPIFLVQGLTDALFPGDQAIRMVNRLRAADPGYPVKLFLGDIGHDYAAERVDEWAIAKRQMNAFLDHALDPARTPRTPAYDVTATVTRCLDHGAPAETRTAPTWSDLHTGHITFTGASVGHSSSTRPGPDGAATDPISTATLPGPKSYKGCRIVKPAAIDPTVATSRFRVPRSLLLMGGPVVAIGYSTTGADTQLDVRVWDVAPDGSEKGLVTRGSYRSTTPAGAGRTATFQLAPQGYRFATGHTIEVQVTANDEPYHLADKAHTDVTVHRVRLTLPLWVAPGATRPAHGGHRSPWPVIVGLALLVFAAIGAAAAVRRRHGHAAGAPSDL